MRIAAIIAAVEFAALALGAFLWHFGVISGRFVIVFPIAVPFIFAVIVLALFANSTRDGGNPFQ
jgi:hypothetical protein